MPSECSICPPDTIGCMEVLERGPLLEQLDDLLAEAAQGHGRLVVVRGEAGIGKTTLVREFTAGRSRRVLWGMCDPVVPPRPLAPVFDIAAAVDGELPAALADSDRNRIVAACLGLLRAEGGPWIVVLEDMQWADEATVDVLSVLGRRIEQLPSLVIVTVRDDEAGPEHLLSVALGQMATASTVTMKVPELSLAAVQQMAAGTSIDPDSLHRAAAGNPYFVTEVLATGDGSLPVTVRDAVTARCSRLSPLGCRVLRAAAILGTRCDAALAVAVSGAANADIDECVSQGLLRRQGSEIEFRHELSQRSVLDATPPGLRAELHREALDNLRDRYPPVDTAELARHAAEAGDAGAVLEFAPKAARQAASLGAHRAAATHYATALKHAHLLAAPERAEMMAAYAREAFLTDAIDDAIASEEAALDLWREEGEVVNQGRSLTRLSYFMWWAETSQDSLQVAAEAVTLLESIPPSADLASAYARSAQLLMITGRHTGAVADASKAVTLAHQFDAGEVLINALDTLGCSHISLGDSEGWAELEQSLARALSADVEEEAARAFNNLMANAVNERRYRLFDTTYDRAEAYFSDRELDQQQRCLIGTVVEGRFGQGRWQEAEEIARAVIAGGRVAGRLESLIVLGRLATRRGESDAMAWLDQAIEFQARWDLPYGYAIRTYRAEEAWLAGDLRKAAAEIDLAMAEVNEYSNRWYLGHLAFVAHQLGLDLDLNRTLPEPYAFYFEGHPEKAAALWAEMGCLYEQAMMLAESSDESDLRQALSILRSFGAEPMATMVTERLKSAGARRIPRGPRTSTRSNPGGLSDRELEVLALLGQGLRNAEIASELVVSRRTVDHHVSAILAKLDARSRFEAGQKARELGLVDL